MESDTSRTIVPQYRIVWQDRESDFAGKTVMWQANEFLLDRITKGGLTKCVAWPFVE